MIVISFGLDNEDDDAIAAVGPYYYYTFKYSSVS